MSMHKDRVRGDHCLREGSINSFPQEELVLCPGDGWGRDRGIAAFVSNKINFNSYDGYDMTQTQTGSQVATRAMIDRIGFDSVGEK